VDNFPSFTELGHLPVWYEYALLRKTSGRPGTAGGRDGTINGGILRFGVCESSLSPAARAPVQ
tara:strand:+ start:349 stop:537 length:189 start_codon:yes stop_codon:yes gene_type:complete